MAYDLTARLRLLDSFSAPMRKATESIKNMRNNTEKATESLGNYYDANGRLRDANGKFLKMNNSVNKSVNDSNGAFGALGNTTRSILGPLTALITTIGGAALAYKGLQATIGGAMELETNKLTLTALVGDAEKANQLFDMLQTKALSSTFDERDFQGAGKAYLPVTKDIDEIEKLLGLTERLGASNPLQGMEGAAFSIRELLADDYTSIVERFNLPRSVIKDALKGADTVEQKIAALDKVLNDMGYTQQFVSDVNASASAQWSMLASNVSMGLAKMGTAALEKLKGPLTELNEWFSGGGFDWVIEKGSDFLVDAAQKAIDFAEYIKTNWPQIKEKIFEVKEALTPIGEAFMSVFDMAKRAGAYIIDNWSTIKPTVIGTAIALGTLKAAFVTMSIIQTVTKFMKAFQAATVAGRVAMLGLNSAMLLNPMTWIIVAIIALIAGIVYLVRNFEWARDTITKVFEWLRPYIVGAMETVKEAFRVVKDYIASVMPLITEVIRRAWSVIGPIFFHNLTVIWEFVKLAFNTVWNIIKVVFTAIIDYISVAWTVISGSFKSSLQILTGDFSGAWETMKETVVTAVGKIGELFSNFVSGAVDIGKNFVQGVIDGFLSVWDSLISTAKSIWSSVTSVFSGEQSVNVKVKGRKADGHAYHGERYVPRDGMNYTLHRGEAVLPRKEAEAYRNGNGGGAPSVNISGNTFHVRQESDIDAIANALAIKINQAREAGA